MNKIIPKVLMYLLPFIILALIIFLLGQTKEQKITTVTNKEISTPTPTPEIFVPSKWVGDEGVLEIESSIFNLEKDLEKVDLRELQILPPVLDMKVEF